MPYRIDVLQKENEHLKKENKMLQETIHSLSNKKRPGKLRWRQRIKEILFFEVFPSRVIYSVVSIFVGFILIFLIYMVSFHLDDTMIEHCSKLCVSRKYDMGFIRGYGNDYFCECAEFPTREQLVIGYQQLPERIGIIEKADCRFGNRIDEKLFERYKK